MPIISVIIPSYNVEKFIVKCLKSLQNQTFSDFEVIIIDDSFLDNTKKLIKDFIKDDIRFSLIEIDHQKKYSAGRKRNIGIEKSVGEFIAFVDSDDYVEKEMLERAYRYSVGNDTDICLFNVRQVDKRGNLIKTSNICDTNFNVVYTKDNFIENFVKYWLSVESVHYACNKLYKSSTIKKNNVKYDNEIILAEDVLFNYNVLKSSKKVGYIQDVLYNYVRHEDSVTNNNKNLEVIVQQFCKLFYKTIELFENAQISNISLIRPILFIKLMTQSMLFLKVKTKDNFELIEKYYDVYFSKSNLLYTFNEIDLDLSINYFINNSNVNKYTKEDYLDFFNTLIKRNGAIIERQRNFKKI